MVYKFLKVKVQDSSWKLIDFGAFLKFKTYTNRRRCELTAGTSAENVTKSGILNLSWAVLTLIEFLRWMFFLRKNVQDKSPRSNASDDGFSCRLE